MQWGILPATLLISFFLLGIDEIAIQLEEPFGILPLESLCDTIQRNVFEILERRNDVKDVVRRYKANTGQGRAPTGWAPPPRTAVLLDEEGSIPPAADTYMHVVFESNDRASHMRTLEEDDPLPLAQRSRGEDFCDGSAVINPSSSAYNLLSNEWSDVDFLAVSSYAPSVVLSIDGGDKGGAMDEEGHHTTLDEAIEALKAEGGAAGIHAAGRPSSVDLAD